MENADPTARRDLEKFFERLVPEDTPYFEHTAEGADDSTLAYSLRPHSFDRGHSDRGGTTPAWHMAGHIPL
jgi:hypothetical protein